ncbi:hypothetical protein FRC00_004141, partial [Tulasnella sp. 408]
PLYDYDESAGYAGAPIEVLEDIASFRELPEIKWGFKKLRKIMVNHCILPDDRVRPVAEFIATICTKPPYLDLPIRAEARGDWYAVQKEVEAIIEPRQT